MRKFYKNLRFEAGSAILRGFMEIAISAIANNASANPLEQFKWPFSVQMIRIPERGAEATEFITSALRTVNGVDNSKYKFTYDDRFRASGSECMRLRGENWEIDDAVSRSYVLDDAGRCVIERTRSSFRTCEYDAYGRPVKYSYIDFYGEGFSEAEPRSRTSVNMAYDEFGRVLLEQVVNEQGSRDSEGNLSYVKDYSSKKIIKTYVGTPSANEQSVVTEYYSIDEVSQDWVLNWKEITEIRLTDGIKHRNTTVYYVVSGIEGLWLGSREEYVDSASASLLAGEEQRDWESKYYGYDLLTGKLLRSREWKGVYRDIDASSYVFEDYVFDYDIDDDNQPVFRNGEKRRDVYKCVGDTVLQLSYRLEKNDGEESKTWYVYEDQSYEYDGDSDRVLRKQSYGSLDGKRASYRIYEYEYDASGHATSRTYSRCEGPYGEEDWKNPMPSEKTEWRYHGDTDVVEVVTEYRYDSRSEVWEVMMITEYVYDYDIPASKVYVGLAARAGYNEDYPYLLRSVKETDKDYPYSTTETKFFVTDYSESLGVENVEAESSERCPVTVYSLSGVLLGTFATLDEARLAPGLYIVRQGAATRKVAVQ